MINDVISSLPCWIVAAWRIALRGSSPMSVWAKAITNLVARAAVGGCPQTTLFGVIFLPRFFWNKALVARLDDSIFKHPTFTNAHWLVSERKLLLLFRDCARTGRQVDHLSPRSFAGAGVFAFSSCTLPVYKIAVKRFSPASRSLSRSSSSSRQGPTPNLNI
jgi:hypothetical protein